MFDQREEHVTAVFAGHFVIAILDGPAEVNPPLAFCRESNHGGLGHTRLYTISSTEGELSREMTCQSLYVSYTKAEVCAYGCLQGVSFLASAPVI